METFAQRLTLLREAKDLKKKELADILNVSASCVSQYENGSSTPGYDTLCRISQYFGVSIDYLMGNNTDTLCIRLEDTFYGSTTYLELLSTCSKIPTEKRNAFLAMLEVLQE